MDFQPTNPPFSAPYPKSIEGSANGEMAKATNEHQLSHFQTQPVQLRTSESTRQPTEELSEDSIDLAPTCEKSAGSDTIVSRQVIASPSNVHAGNWKFFGASVNQELQAENQTDNIVKKLDSGELWVVNSRRRNGLIVLREFHAEFAGPGAAVGGGLDEDIVNVIPIGNLSLLEPDSHEAHQNAIKIRLQWIRLTQNFTDQPEPKDRARMILEQFKTYFDQDTVDTVPDEAFALLVGVLPQTIRRVRSGFVW